ncbi:MAG: hypothetical protein M0Z31_08190 [Clostridia bacterium]|nr:hypothetical protein [Clostridia bacterium]
MPKRPNKGIGALIVLVIVILALTGCGDKPVAQIKPTPEEVKLVSRISEFSSKVEPIYQQGEDSYKKLTKAITDFGYGNITKEKLEVVVRDTLAATKEAKANIDKVEVPEDLMADLDEVKSGLATAVWLREQKYPNLIAVLQKPNPKSSELNAILGELKGTEAFLDNGRNKLTQLKQRYGIK